MPAGFRLSRQPERTPVVADDFFYWYIRANSQVIHAFTLLHYIELWGEGEEEREKGVRETGKEAEMEEMKQR